MAYKQGWLSVLGLSPAAAPVAAAAPVVNPNAIVGANTLDGIFARMLKAAPAGNHSIDEWDYFLQAAQPSITPPDPMPLFAAAVPGFDRSQPIAAAQYWAVMAPALKQQLGLSGLGIFGGLGALAMGYR